MQIRLGLGVCTVAGLIWAAGVTGRADPLHDSRRLIAGQPVDLTPLFHWWTNQSGVRPLSAWRHVTGSIIDTNAWGWTLEARVESSTNQSRGFPPRGSLSVEEAKVVLRNPPVWEQAQFELLTARIQELNEERQFLLSQSSEAANLSRQIKSMPRRSRAANAEVRQLDLRQAQTKTLLKTAETQIRECRAKLGTFPDATRYTVDCVALARGERFHGMAVLDYGLAVPEAPGAPAPASRAKAP